MKRKDNKISSNKCDLDNREYDNNLHVLRKELKQFDLKCWTSMKSFV
jgi:hypothetical protein